jgi:hypothetical protein
MGLSTADRPSRRFSRRAPHGAGAVAAPAWADPSGLAVNSVAGALFGGLVAFVLVFPLIARAQLPGYLYRWALVVGGVLCCILMLGIYLFLSDLRRRRFQQGTDSPLYLRSLQRQSIRRACADLERRLEEGPEADLALLTDMLRDRLCRIVEKDCRNRVDIQKQVERSGLCAARGTGLERYLATRAEYEAAGLPDEIEQVAALVAAGQSRFAIHLKRLKAAHKKLFSVMGDYLEMIPPSPDAVLRIEMTYPYLPKGSEETRRLLFVLTLLPCLRKEAMGRLCGGDADRLKALARQRVPRLREAVNSYKAAWERMAADYRTWNRPGAGEPLR